MSFNTYYRQEFHCRSCTVQDAVATKNQTSFDSMDGWKQRQYQDLMESGVQVWDVICFQRTGYSHYGIVSEINVCDRNRVASDVRVVHVENHGIMTEVQMVHVWAGDGIEAGFSGPALAYSTCALTRQLILSSASRGPKSGKEGRGLRIYVDNRDHLMRDKRLPTDDERKKRVNQLLGTEVGYSLRSKNCEHWARDIRHGVKRSTQVETVQNNVLTAAVISAGVMGVAFAITSMLTGRKSENVSEDEEDQICERA